jgi:hypothetical protein
MPSCELFSRGNWLLIIIGVPRDDNRLDVSGGGLLVARWRLLPILILIELILPLDRDARISVEFSFFLMVLLDCFGFTRFDLLVGLLVSVKVLVLDLSIATSYIGNAICPHDTYREFVNHTTQGMTHSPQIFTSKYLRNAKKLDVPTSR